MGSIFTTVSTAASDSESSYDTDEGEYFDEDTKNINDNKKKDLLNMIHVNNSDKNLRIDAIENKTHCNFANSQQIIKLTIKNLQDIENSLEFYEKVSLVFLLYEHEDVALQSLLVEENHNIRNIKTESNMLTTWARSKYSSLNWHDQILEALCIIQNYSQLRKLGYDVKDLKLRFLPNISNTSLHLNIVRKALYHICDNFNANKTDQFIKLLHKDFEEKGILFQKFNKKYLEMYFLHCFSMRYITPNDLTNVIKILKVMELEHVCDNLKSIVLDDRNDQQLEKITLGCKQDQMIKQTNDVNSPDNVKVDFHLNEKIETVNFEKNIASCSQNSVIGDNSITNTTQCSSDECYKIDPKNTGLCLIINQEHFYEEKDQRFMLVSRVKLQNRIGTNFDRDKLKDTFELLGFRILIKTDLKHSEIGDCIKDAIDNFTAKDSCFIVCILSHGIEDHIYGINSVPVNIKDIENILLDSRYKNLSGKPKVLIIQSCQGASLQGVVCQSTYNTIDGVAAHPIKYNTPASSLINAQFNIPEKTDLLVCSSTIVGYASIRNEKEGSWYIQELCTVLEKHSSRRHILDILTTVNYKVSSRQWLRDGKSVCMVPVLKSSLRKALFLPPIIQNQSCSTIEATSLIKDCQTI